MAKDASQAGFFSTVYEDQENFDQVRFLTEVESQFKSEEMTSEVRWRLEVLKELTAQDGQAEMAAALRDRLTQIFSTTSDPQEVLNALTSLTEIEAGGDKPVDLRAFIKRERRVYSQGEYRKVLARKLENTTSHVVNLVAYYPESENILRKLTLDLKELTAQAKDPSISASRVKTLEDELRETGGFGMYEDLKERFLKDWLGRFAGLADASLDGMEPGEVQRLVQEHQRHQMTQLLKTQIKLVELDMTSHLGLHDTLEGQFLDNDFWKGCNVSARRGFVEWVLGAVQAFGMIKGQRYVFFQSEQNNEFYLLFGLSLPALSEIGESPIRMVPYVKPFTRKGTYLLEIRKRDIGDTQEYHHELVHYTLPFLFGFDQLNGFKMNKELISFFNSRY